MKLSFTAKVCFVCFLFLITSGCQNQTVSNLSNKTNSPATNSNSGNLTNVETKIPESQTIKFVSAETVEIVCTFY